MKEEDINPFTAMLAAPSLGKRPIKVPNLKSFRLFFSPPFSSPPSHELEKRFISKCSLFKAGLLQDHQIYCLQACKCPFLSPEILQAVARKGLIGFMVAHPPHRLLLFLLPTLPANSDTRSPTTPVGR